MHETKRPLKVFLCHASVDKPKVRELYRYLKRRGIKPWLDEVDLIGGQDWQIEIPKALATSDAIIICLTKNSVDKEGYIQKEIKFALDKALDMPEGRIFLIPVKFEECGIPVSLNRYQWVDLTIEAGYSKMMKALKFRASQLERSTIELSKKTVEEENLAIEKAAKENAEREVAEKVAREKAVKEVAERGRLEAEELERQKVVKERAEHEVAEKAAHEKAEKEADERARLKAEEQAKQKAAKEKAERETIEKNRRENEKSKKVEETSDRKLNPFDSKKIKPQRLLSLSNNKTVFWIFGVAAIITVLIGIVPQYFPSPSAPTATASVTTTLRPVQTATFRSDPTRTITRTPTVFSTNTPDYFGGSEILFATKDGSIYSFENTISSKISSITAWRDESRWLQNLWSWDANKDFFIVQGRAADVDFVDMNGQLISSLNVPYITYCPNLSRDGKKIVVSSQAAMNGNIWVFNNDGSNFMRLSLSSTMRFGCPSWSPDGKTIAAAVAESKEHYVVILDLAGNIVKQFKKPEYFSQMSESLWVNSPKWSLNGKSLIICGDGGVYRLDIDNGDVVKLLSSNVNACDWSPDGNSVVYATTDGLKLLDINTEVVINLLDMKEIVSVAWK